MNKFFWIVAGASLGIGAYILLNNQNAPAYGSGYDVDDAADDVNSGARRFSRNASTWGTGQRVSGAASQLGGKLKQGFGELTGDPETEASGVGDQVVGSVKDTVGRAANAVGDAVDNLTR